MPATGAKGQGLFTVFLPGLRDRGPALVDAGPTLIESDEVFAQIASASGRVLQSSPIISGQRLLPPAAVRAAERTGKPVFADHKLARIDNLSRVLAVPVATSHGRFVVLVGASLQDRQDELVELAATLAVAGGIGLCLTSLGAWLAVAGALRPVGRMRRQAAAISASDPGRRLPVSGGRDELALLGGTLNQMLDRIEDSVGRAWAENLPGGGARVTMATSDGTAQREAGTPPGAP